MTRAFSAAAVAVFAAAAHADFEIVEEIVLPTEQAHGLAFDGTTWYVAQIFEPAWDVFDEEFTYLETTQAALGDAIRGIAFDESSGNLFVADYPSGEILEMTTDGTVVSTFTAAGPNQINAVSVNRLDGTLWVATFNQGVLQFDRNGTLLGGFDTPFFVSGLAIDEAAETLLLMESNNDFVREFNFMGQQIDVPIPLNIIPDNGQGLAYDATTATLYATTQTGPPRVTVFRDPERETLDDGPPPCAGDCDANGAFDRLDFICFMTAWRTEQVAGDCNADGAYNILDFVCFQKAWITRCGQATWQPRRAGIGERRRVMSSRRSR